jgi:small-conductance mechanosensitive channel
MSLLEPALGFLNNPQLLSIITALIIFSIGYFVALVIRRMVFKIGIRFYARNIASIVSKIIYYVILLIALSTALRIL